MRTHSWWGRSKRQLAQPRRTDRRTALPTLVILEDRCVPSTINFVGQLGTASQYQGSATSLDIPINKTGGVAPGHTIILEFALKPSSSGSDTASIGAYVHAPNSS